ncbi:MAG TPA: polyphosphate kinase 1, partial [Thermoanaerobaculia bacterium]|nr:polyphosphate kinase 1 [Thermoanaerobaculia bacterium]
MADLDEAVASDVAAPQQPAATPVAVKVPAIAVPAEPVRLFNREFSWIEFNRRVLAEALDPSVPLLERVKFLAITANNLDEFLMVRVGAIRELVATGIQERSSDGLTPKQQIKGIRERVSSLMAEMYRCLEELLPELHKAGIRIETFAELSKKEQAALGEHFERQIAPILTPLAVDPGHPFPFLASRALNVAVMLDTERGESHVAFVKVPPILPRLIPIPDGPMRFIPIESLIEVHLSRFFPGLLIRRVVPFRVLRNADILLQEDEVQDLLKSVETELRRRERKEVVWMEIASGAEESLLDLLGNALHTKREEVFSTGGLLKLSDLMEIYERIGKSSLKEPPFNPRIPAQLATSEDIFSIIRKGDVLLHRPYDSFAVVVDLVQSAAEDPDVVAIKQTLYRTETGSVIVEALAQAALRGKQVTAVVELQARFDEMKNIVWARRLEEAGVQVVYGLIGIKTHSKVCVVIRREGSALRRYVHLSTGNYNAVTSQVYTDIDLLTADEEIADDALQLMTLLTGYSISTVQDIFDKQAPGWSWRRLVVSPIDYHDWTVRMIEREARNARDGKPAQILAKMNSLVDPTVIEALYKASQAGVKIDLIVRGICCLVPGVAGLSENIRVMSIIDRFLEHTRIFLFRNAGATEVFVSSGDWMPRNFFRRIEVTWPVVADKLRARLEEQILATSLADNVKAWKLHADGTWRRKVRSDTPVRSQERFIETARSEAVRVGP